jgi:hypothetical protein
VVGCAQTVYGQLGANWRSARAGTVVVGPIAWPYLRLEVNQVAIGRSHFVKALVVVNPGRAVTLSIPISSPTSERSRVSLDYTNISPRSRFYVSQGANSVTFKPCASPAGQRQFAGGFIVAGPQCAAVNVHAAGSSTSFLRFIPLGRSCDGSEARTPVRKVLLGNGIDQAKFGETPAEVVRQLQGLLGRAPSKLYHTTGNCTADHAIDWTRLEVYFHGRRFVGYSYGWRKQPSNEPVLATKKGLRVGDTVAEGKRLGAAFNNYNGGTWLVNTHSGRIGGFTGALGPHAAPRSPARILTIEAGNVGCPAMTP